MPPTTKARKTHARTAGYRGNQATKKGNSERGRTVNHSRLPRAVPTAKPQCGKRNRSVRRFTSLTQCHRSDRTAKLRKTILEHNVVRVRKLRDMTGTFVLVDRDVDECGNVFWMIFDTQAVSARKATHQVSLAPPGNISHVACSCRSPQVCSHRVFVMCDIIGLEPSSELVSQWTLVESEVKLMLANEKLSSRRSVLCSGCFVEIDTEDEAYEEGNDGLPCHAACAQVINDYKEEEALRPVRAALEVAAAAEQAAAANAAAVAAMHAAMLAAGQQQ